MKTKVRIMVIGLGRVHCIIMVRVLLLQECCGCVAFGRRAAQPRLKIHSSATLFFIYAVSQCRSIYWAVSISGAHSLYVISAIP